MWGSGWPRGIKAQALRYVCLLCGKHRSAGRAVCRGRRTSVKRCKKEGGQQVLFTGGINHGSRCRNTRIEVANIASMRQVSGMVFPAQSIFERKAGIDAEGILGENPVVHC